MTTTMNDRGAILAKSAADIGREIQRRRNLPVPKDLQAAEAIAARLTTMAAQPVPTAPALPDNAGKLERTIADAADARVRATTSRDLANELRPAADARLTQATSQAAAGWIDPLVRAFDKTLDALRETARIAPSIAPEHLSLLSPEAFEHWHRFTAAALEADSLVTDRTALGRLIRENPHSHWGGELPVIGAVRPPHGTAREVREAFQLRAVIKSTAATTDPSSRWRAWLGHESEGWLDLSMAPAGSIGSRVALVEAWPGAFWSAQTQDGGRAFDAALTDADHLWRTAAVLAG